MIDSTGKKIINTENAVDIELLMKEISFFTKIFRKEPTDDLAISISNDIVTFIKARGNIPSVMDSVNELECYSSKSESEDFVWNLVYIRRRIAGRCGGFLSDLKGKLYAAECRYIAAKHFNRICEIKPTVYNKCCEVQEYVSARIEFKNARIQLKSKNILNYAEKIFAHIEKSDQPIYYSTGVYLYIELYTCYAKGLLRSRANEALKKAVEYSFNLYEVEKIKGNLEKLSLYYKEYIDNEEYYFVKEKDRLQKLINWIEEIPEPDSTLSTRLTEFKKIFAKYNVPYSTT